MKKLGTFGGVFVPSFEAILGAVLFLILPLLVGAVGLWQMLIIVALANTATVATAFSLSDAATNLNNIGAGGMYAISKRSLGAAFGGSIGMQLYVAQAVSIGFYAAGFAEPVQRILMTFPAYVDLIEALELSALMQRQLIASVAVIIGLVIALIGADVVTRLQLGIFFILVAAVGVIMISPLMQPVRDGVPVFTGEPMSSGVIGRIGFFAAFATFFPAVTGIDAGVGMSGSLKDARRSLGRGTFAAILVTTAVYGLVTYIFSLVRPELLQFQNGIAPSTMDIFAEAPVILYVLLFGIIVATASSALAYFLTAPRTAQAIAVDGLFPKMLSFLGKDFRKGGSEPRWATLVTFILAFSVIWSGDISFISLIVGICFLVVYGWVNLAAFFERVSGNPSFRPTSKGHWLISLYGFLVCMAVIALFNVWIGIGVLSVQLLLFYLLLKYRSGSLIEGVWWGLVFRLLHWGFDSMEGIIQGSKNWRPIVGIFGFVDKATETSHVLRMGRRISEYKGITMVNLLSPVDIHKAVEHGDSEMKLDRSSRIVAVPDSDYASAVSAIVQAAAPGGLQMNTVLMSIDSRLGLYDLTQDLIRREKHVLLYKPGLVVEGEGKDRIDVWWKGYENGNFMALLAYIINQSDASAGGKTKQIRMIRKLQSGEDREIAFEEMQKLLDGARLPGEVLIIEPDTIPIHESIQARSMDAGLIFMGMPGKQMGGLAHMFDIDERLFARQFEKFKDFPPMLFVKAAYTVDLFE